MYSMTSMEVVRQKLVDDLRDATDRRQESTTLGLFESRLNRRNDEARRVSARQQVLSISQSTIERHVLLDTTGYCVTA